MTKLTIWNRGDVVRLKSGGPKMTISGVPTEAPEGKTGKTGAAKVAFYTVSCDWFEGPVHREGCFDSESIKRAKV